MSTRHPSKALQPQDWAIAQLPGLSPADQALLLDDGIQTTRQLLQHTQTAAQKQALASHLQIHLQHLNKWIALADLARIPGVGCQYCGLLLHAGVSSPLQLAAMPIARLHQQILKLHISMMQRQDLCPTLGQVAQWIEQAKAISRADQARKLRSVV